MDNRFRVDKELQNYMTPLSNEEYKALEESILSEGCRDKLIVWKNKRFPILVDGHNRFEICRMHNIPFEIQYMEFENYQDAMAWMIKNQLARRNLTDEQRKYLIGKQLANEKWSHGGDRKSEISSRHFDDLKTAEKIAEEHGVSSRTVERNQDYAKAVDALGDSLGEEVKTKILTSEIKLTDKDTKELSQEPPEVQSKVIDIVVTKQAKNLEDAKQLIDPLEEEYKQKVEEIEARSKRIKKVLNLLDYTKVLGVTEQHLRDYLEEFHMMQDDFISNCDRAIKVYEDAKELFYKVNQVRRVK